jgi:hypothetical protein
MSLPQLRAALARTTKLYGPDAPETLALRRDYELEKTMTELRDRLEVSRFTPSQLDTLAALVESARAKAEAGS